MKKFILFAVMAMALTVSAPSAVMAANGTVETGIISPFWQANAKFYTLIAITNPSTSTATSRTVTIEVLNRTGTVIGSLDVGVSPGDMEMVFLSSTANSSAPTGFTGNNYSSNQHRIDTNPFVSGSGRTSGSIVIEGTGVSELSIWGAVFVPSTFSGFAMEFIGDRGDTITKQ